MGEEWCAAIRTHVFDRLSRTLQDPTMTMYKILMKDVEADTKEHVRKRGYKLESQPITEPAIAKSIEAALDRDEKLVAANESEKTATEADLGTPAGKKLKTAAKSKPKNPREYLAHCSDKALELKACIRKNSEMADSRYTDMMKEMLSASLDKVNQLHAKFECFFLSGESNDVVKARATSYART